MENSDGSEQQISECRIMSDGSLNSQPAHIGLTLPMQLNQQIMASSGSNAANAVGLTSPVQLLPTVSNSSSVSMPWMVPSYPMMVLQQGLPQSLFAPNVLALQDGHVMLAPIDDSGTNHQVVADPAVQLSKSSSKPQEQWLANAISTKTHSAKGATELCSPRQGLLNVSGATQQIRNGSASVVANRNSQQQQQQQQQQTPASKPEIPIQPKKPLTPYMLFSKSIWPHVKAANSHLSSVCEIGAIIGSLWRDMDPKEKQRYNDLFAKDKERYENELRAYLKTTGLHASDLAKQPKPKRNRDKPATSWPSFSPSSAQPGIQTVVGNATGTAAAGQDGSAADLLPTFSQAWTGQMAPQLTAQQVLTQLGLSGQALFANSDGSISVGGNHVSNLLALQSQSLQLVSVTGEPVMTIYSDPGQTGVSQLGTITTSSDSAGNLDGTRSSWVWQQPSGATVVSHQEGADTGGGAGGGVVLYHMPSSGDSLGKVIELKGHAGGGGDPMDTSTSGRSVIPTMDQMQQYTVDQLGQLVSETAADSSSREAELEAELRQMSCALMEKAKEVSELTSKLKEAYEIIERYKQLSGEAVAPSSDGGSKNETMDSANDAGGSGLEDGAEASADAASVEN